MKILIVLCLLVAQSVLSAKLRVKQRHNTGVTIVNRHSGKCLDIQGMSEEDSANVIQWDCKPGFPEPWNQYFFITVDGDKWTIYNVVAGKVFDIRGESNEDDAELIMFGDKGNDNQRFRIEDVDGEWKKIVNVKSGKCLDIIDFSKENGTKVIQWNCTGGENQQFKFKEL